MSCVSVTLTTTWLPKSDLESTETHHKSAWLDSWTSCISEALTTMSHVATKLIWDQQKHSTNSNNNNKSNNKTQNLVHRDYFKHIHTGICIHEHSDCTKLNLHNLKRAAETWDRWKQQYRMENMAQISMAWFMNVMCVCSTDSHVTTKMIWDQ